MPELLEQRLQRLLSSDAQTSLCGGRKGLEKESLRITTDGALARTPHPAAWGAPLTHPYITTDYSEALPEFITPPHAEVTDTLNFLDDIHRFLYQKLPQEEMLWATSMPCAVADDRDIPIAEYGSSNSGRMKHIYRVGLDRRYGRRMQAIAGVHFNYSLPPAFWPAYHSAAQSRLDPRDFQDASYFALIRNFKRLGWIVPFLFGNSPAVCKSFLAGRTTRFQELRPGTHYLPYATSLRMSDIGYKNKNQAALRISYDSLSGYVDSLQRALRTPYPEYEAIGLFEGDSRVQLSTNVLQIENEYYSFIRPKRTTQDGERPTQALRARGVEYVEVRALDVNTLSPIGVEAEQLRFLEAFLIFCLLEDSPPLSDSDLRDIEYNELTVALRGRTPNLELLDRGRPQSLQDWVLGIFERMIPICEILDAGNAERHYSQSLQAQVEATQIPDRLPSARILETLKRQNEQFHHYALAMSANYAQSFRARPPSSETEAKFVSLAETSHQEQRLLEASDDIDLGTYIQRYIAD